MNTKELEKEFVEMITEYQQIIYKVCYMYATDDYTLDELYQETVINLWKGYAHFREESKVTTWIYRIAINTCISYFRKLASRPVTIPLSFDLDQMLLNDKNENYYLQELYRMINKLGKMDRALILLWLDERSYQEISLILGISLSNVGVRLNRVKDKLKEKSNH